MNMTKIGFIGAGRVGSTSAYATLYSLECDEIVLVDIIEDLAVGEAMDIETAAVTVGKDVVVRGGSDFTLLNDSDVVVVSAGLARKVGMTRLDLTQTNVGIVSDVTKKMMRFSPNAIIVMVTNPVDIMTYAAYKVSKKPRNQVLGMGSLHDTARLKSEIRKLGVKNVKAMMIGEHGDSMLPLESQASFEGVELDWDIIIESVKNRAINIIKRKGATFYTPASCVATILRAIINDERVEIPISAVLEGEYDLHNLAIGVPAIVGREGLVEIVEYDLTVEELTKLRRSASILKSVANSVGLLP